MRSPASILQEVLGGNHPVVATNHTLILNWNRETIPLLRQIAIAKRESSARAFSGRGSDPVLEP